MRQLGKLDSEADVRRFADYLLTLGIKTQVEPDDAGWALWVYHEDHVEQARQEYAEFLKNPADPRYQEAVQEAARVRKVAARRERDTGRLVIDVRKRWQQP